MSQPQKEHFFELLHHFKYGMMTTHAQSGALHTRPMALLKVEPNGDIWLVADVNSEKVGELNQDARISLSMQDGQKFVALHGRGELLRDPDKVAQLWEEGLRVWFPRGPTDPAIILLKISSDQGEFWDNSGLHRAKYIFEAAKAYVTGQVPPPDKDLRGTVGLSS
jgi:general stress protein 26